MIYKLNYHNKKTKMNSFNNKYKSKNNIYKNRPKKIILLVLLYKIKTNK